MPFSRVWGNGFSIAESRENKRANYKNSQKKEKLSSEKREKQKKLQKAEKILRKDRVIYSHF